MDVGLHKYVGKYNQRTVREVNSKIGGGRRFAITDPVVIPRAIAFLNLGWGATVTESAMWPCDWRIGLTSLHGHPWHPIVKKALALS